MRQAKEREVICQWCGKLFTTKAFRAKYCSVECKNKSAYQMKKKKLALPQNNLREVVRQAEAKGMSYGEYVARYMR